MYLIVAVLIVVIVVGVAGYMFLGNNAGTDTNPTATPGPDTVVGATTVQFSVNETTIATGDLVGYSFACKDYDTGTEVVRVDICIADQTYSYILDAGLQESWVSLDNGATWMAGVFADDWVAYGSLFNDFVGRLADQGNTMDLSYTTDTTSITIYCVAVNETIADSMFATS